MTLDELKASAPRSFDKTLIDLLVSIQQGGQPIVVADDASASRIASLEAQVQELSQALADAAADRANLMNICRALDDRISSFGVKVEKAA